MKKHLLTPGPVELPAEVSAASAKQLISHRCPDFSALFERIESKLSMLLKCDGPIAILPCSGTGALECLAVNFLGPKDKFISVSCGAFGARFREIAARTGAACVPVDVPFGEAADAELVAHVVMENPGCAALLLTQNETSTGVRNDIQKIIASLPQERPLVFIDGVSSVGAMECFPQEWGVDGLATASQKGLLTPPGLGLVWLSKRARAALNSRSCPSYYYDLKLHYKELEKDSPANPFTPPVSLYFALDSALDLILAEGADKWFAAHRRYARALAAGVEALGFELLVKDAGARSSGMTAFSLPGGDAEAVRKGLRDMGVETAGGQGAYKGRLIRAAHYGECGWPELSMLLGALFAASYDYNIKKNCCLATAYKEWKKEN